MDIGAVVVIEKNAVWRRLAGHVGTVVHVTKAAKCYGANGCERSNTCGNNPVVLVDGEKWLLPKEAVTVVADVEMVA